MLSLLDIKKLYQSLAFVILHVKVKLHVVVDRGQQTDVAKTKNVDFSVRKNDDNDLRFLRDDDATPDMD